MARKNEEAAAVTTKRETMLSVAADINKHYKRSVITPASSFPVQSRLRIKNPAVDYCMGGGTAIGRIHEFYGPESSGKTYNAMLAIIQYQKYDWNNQEPDAVKVLTYKENKTKYKTKTGAEVSEIIYTPDKIEYAKRGGRMKYVALIDVEGTYDKDWGEYMGIDNKLLIRIVPQTGEEAVDVAYALLMNPDICLVVFDSVAVTRASAEVEKEMDEQTMGQQARFWNRAAVKMQMAMNNNPEEVTMILINRAYTKVGLVFGDPEEIGSGSGLKFAKAISMKFTAMKHEKGEVDGIEDVTIGRVVKVENKKNKTSRPYKFAQYYFVLSDDSETGLYYGDTDEANDMTELGVRLGYVERSGNTYKFGRLSVNGRDNFLQSLRKHRPALDALIDKIVNHV